LISCGLFAFDDYLWINLTDIFQGLHIASDESLDTYIDGKGLS
jgi:hypothetical protein